MYLFIASAIVDTVDLPAINAIQQERLAPVAKGLPTSEFLVSVASRSNPFVEILTSGVGKDVGGESDSATEGAFFR